MSQRSDVRRFVRAAIAGALIASVPFLTVLWNFGLHPMRTAVPNGIFSNFFEVQAQAIMAGHLNVPRASLGFEAWQFGHREYTYFGPFPALLRIPVMAITHRFDGRMTAPSMLIAWMLFVTFTALLLWRVRRIVRREAPLGRREAVAYACLIVTAGGGSAIVYLAALPWVYHEALIWSTAMAVGALYAIVGVLERPTVGRLAAAAVLATGAILSRAPSGWACCLILVGAAMLMVFHPRRRNLRWAGGVLAAGAVPLAIGIAVNWAKFRNPIMIPFESQVWTRLSEHRRQALAANGGGLFGPQFLPSTVASYFRPDGIRFSSIFPFISLPAQPAPTYGGAFLDLTYRTGSLPSFMPLLFILGCWGVVVTFRRRVDDRIARLRLPLLGAAAITSAVMCVGYISHRYAAEFMPVLIFASAVGVADLAGRSVSWSEKLRAVGLGFVVALALFGVLANTAVGTTAANETSGGQPLRNLVSVEKKVSDWTGHHLDGYVEQGSTLPPSSAPDRLRVIGDCQAVYVATGERYEPWVPVEVRGLSVDITVTATSGFGSVRLVKFDGFSEGFVELQHNGQGMYRLVVDGRPGYTPGEWRKFDIGTVFSLRVIADPEHLAFVVYAPSLIYTTFPLTDWELNHQGDVATPYLLREAPVPETQQAALGVKVSARRDSPSKLCRGLIGR